MNAEPGQNVVISKRELERLLFIRSIQSIVLTVLLALAYYLWISTKEPTYPTITRELKADAMYTSCPWPQGEGEMTVVAVLDGKRTCWRWR